MRMPVSVRTDKIVPGTVWTLDAETTYTFLCLSKRVTHDSVDVVWLITSREYGYETEAISYFKHADGYVSTSLKLVV